MSKKIIIGSRGSDLALWQAHFVQDRLKTLNIESEIKIIATKGDKIQDLSFDKIEGKGFFTKEIEEALLNKEIDLAVHSHKDLETEQPQGLTVAAVSGRADAADILLIRKECVDENQRFSLKKNAIVGTSSARRKSQFLMFRSDVEIKDLRGNVPTRIDKLRLGNYDAILLASAGVGRLKLNLNEFFVERLDPKQFIPAPAQGVLALQIREDDTELFTTLQDFNNKTIQSTCFVERKILNLFDGGCQLPLGAYCEMADDEETYNVWLAVANKPDSTPVSVYAEGKNPETLAERMVEKAKSLNPTSVFITRELFPDDLFHIVLSNLGYDVTGKPLIETTQIPIIKTPKTDWIFFSSKNAVYHFFKQNPEIKSDAKIGVIGRATAEALRKFDKRADFIGVSADTKLIGKQFRALVGRTRVLFPQAKKSIKSIQGQMLDKDQAINLFVYETIENPEYNIPDSEVLVFTSPSNVEAFYKTHTIKPHQKVVAIGHATASELKNRDIHHPKLPDAFDGLSLARAVMSL